MPYLSWLEGALRRRHHLVDACLIGRDAGCTLSTGLHPSLSRQHARLVRQGQAWWIQDLGSVNGTWINDLPVSVPMGGHLQDGDLVRLGEWTLRFTESFPGLDGVDFAEGVGTPFQEARQSPDQYHLLLQAMELLTASQETLLREGHGEGQVHGMLEEALRLFRADRGFVVMVTPEGAWRRAAVVGPETTGVDLSGSVLHYVKTHVTGVLSNRPALDPRFQGASVAGLRIGPLMCAPLELEQEVMGMLYLDRRESGEPFSRLDLALFQTLVRMGTLALRHTHLVQRALEQAELQGVVARMKVRHEIGSQRLRGLLLEIQSASRWVDCWAMRHQEAASLQRQAARIQYLVERGFQEFDPEAPEETEGPLGLGGLHEQILRTCRELAAVQDGLVTSGATPRGTLWGPASLAFHGVLGLLEPALLDQGPGGHLHLDWQEGPGTWELTVTFRPEVAHREPDTWTVRALSQARLAWQWTDRGLKLSFPAAGESPIPGEQPVVGVVSSDPSFQALVAGVGEAGDVQVLPLPERPAPAPLPGMECVVLDATGFADPLKVLMDYRQHQDVVAVPVLVTGIDESQLAAFLAAGATDWLGDGFRYEALHHRIQVLRGLGELKQKALASERLDALRQMAGTLKHEINNPLAVISMQVELLERKYEDEPKLRKIGDMVERIRDLVQVLQKMREAQVEAYPGGDAILKAGGAPGLLL